MLSLHANTGDACMFAVRALKTMLVDLRKWERGWVQRERAAMWWKARFRCAPFTPRQRERGCDARRRLNNPTESCQAWGHSGKGRARGHRPSYELGSSLRWIRRRRSPTASLLSRQPCPDTAARCSQKVAGAIAMLSLSSFTLVRGVASRCATHLARSRQARYLHGRLGHQRAHSTRWQK